MLEPGHERDVAAPSAPGRRARPGRPRRRSRGSGVAIPPAAARSRARADRSGAVIQTPRRRSGGSGRSASGSIGSSSAAVRDPSVPSAKHFMPAEAGPAAGRAPSGAPLRSPPAIAVSSASSRMRGVDADRQPAGLGQARVGRDTTSRGPGRERAARVVDRDDAQAEQVARRRRSTPPRGPPGAMRRDVDGHEPGRRLVEDALGLAVARRGG